MEQFQDTLAARHRRLKRIEPAAQVADGVEEPIDVQHEGNQHTCRDRFAKYRRATEIDNDRGGDRAQHIHNRREDGGHFGRV